MKIQWQAFENMATSYVIVNQWNTIIYVLEWAKMQTLDNNEARIWSNLPFIASVMQNGTNSWEDSLVISYKAKQCYHIIQQSHSVIVTQMNWKFMSTQKPAL